MLAINYKKRVCFLVTTIISTIEASGFPSYGVAQSNLSLSTTLLAVDSSLESKIHAVSFVHLKGLPASVSSLIIHDALIECNFLIKQLIITKIIKKIIAF